MRRTRARTLLLALLVGAALPARAAAAPPETPEPPVVLALGAGMATVMLPLVLGVTHTADATSDASRVTGLAVAGVGCALAPFVSHAVLGEYARGAAFSAVPLAAEIGVVSLVTAMPDAVFHGTQLSRTTFGILFSFDVFGAALGLIDVALAPERGRKHGGLTVVPSVGRGHAGILVGGTL